jgi:transaldolase
MSVDQAIRVNMTLCCSQEQAAAVYAATKRSKEPVYVSPFLGRLDDHGENGTDLVANIKKMYEAGDSPYESLDLSQPWETLDIRHELTTKGIQQFVADYKSTLKQSAEKR